MSNPKVLLLGEPEGIQPSIIREMGRTLKSSRDRRGLSILVSEQVLEFRARHRRPRAGDREPRNRA